MNFFENIVSGARSSLEKNNMEANGKIRFSTTKSSQELIGGQNTEMKDTTRALNITGSQDKDINSQDITKADAVLNNKTALDLTPIQQFYDGANVFITGATGFLGKILVEKLLRSCPTISTLYLLVRQKKGKSMEARVDEMFEDAIFNRLKKECPEYRQKILGVAGDCSLPELGLNLHDKRFLINETNIVFHVAATVRFDEKIKTAIEINIRGSRDLARLCREMTKLKSFIHVSTVYSNCPKSFIEEKIYPQHLDGNLIMLMAEELPEHILNDITSKLIHPYPNTYTFTKQIAEYVVKEESKNIPVGVFRPAGVISTYREPVGGWINNIYGPTGVSTGISLGLIRAVRADPTANSNIIPVDMCVNLLIASAWQVAERYQEATKGGKSFEIPVYNYESSSDQPITWGQYLNSTVNHDMSYPTVKAMWFYCYYFCKSYPVYMILYFLLHTIPAVLTDVVLICTGQSPKMIKIYKKIQKLLNVISYFGLGHWVFQRDNIKTLVNQMSEKDRDIFFSDIKQLDWDRYFEGYFKGIRIYLLQDPLDTLDKARKNWVRLYYAHQLVKFILVAILLWILYSVGLRLL